VTAASAIIQRLWDTPADGAGDVYVILDCARDARIHPWIHRRALDFTSLYRGPVAPALDRSAPYLVHLYRNLRWTPELLEMAWGRSWGIFVRTALPMEDLRVHFRKLLRVRDERGRTLIFRYYDPRVLRVYLPTCRPNELALMFGKVGAFFVEDESASAWIRFSSRGGALDRHVVAIDAAE
jgi:hypothetical protein